MITPIRASLKDERRKKIRLGRGEKGAPGESVTHGIRSLAPSNQSI